MNYMNFETPRRVNGKRSYRRFQTSIDGLSLPAIKHRLAEVNAERKSAGLTALSEGNLMLAAAIKGDPRLAELYIISQHGGLPPVRRTRKPKEMKDN